MIKLILFLALVTIISLFISFLGDNGGNLVAYWLGYRVEMPVVFAIKVLSLFLLAVIIVTILVTQFFSLFKSQKGVKIKKLENRYKKGIEYLADGFIAAIAGNIKKAEHNQKNTKKYLENSTLTKLLNSYIEYKKQNYTLAARLLKNSKNKKDEELDYIAEKLYLQNAKKENNIQEIIKHSENALKNKNTSDSAILSLLKIYKEKHDWNNLERIINEAMNKNILSIKKDDYEIASVYLLLAKHYSDNKDYKKAMSYSKKSNKVLPNLLPNSIIFTQTLLSMNKKLSAIHSIKTAWKHHPHPKLYEIYSKIYQDLSPKCKLKKTKSLIKSNPKHYESYIVLANAYLDANILTKAKEEARKAIDERKTSAVYKILAKIERTENPGSNIVNVLEEKAKNTKDDNKWLCSSCGEILEDWDKFCKKCKNVNSIEWNSIKVK
ncbi:heme biosynthesis HemY N-terminal domain-containing protein [Pseudomonadota bacterium]